MRERDFSIDCVTGFFIIVMILSHIVQNLHYKNETLNGFLLLFSFFMPWFFFKGGQFFKQDGIAHSVKSGFNRLIVPYIIYNIIGLCVGFLFYNGQTDLILYLATSIKQLLR